MLQNDFYTIVQSDRVEARQKVRIRLNADHSIFAGHFPEMPVVPGVCMIQMIKELTEQQLDAKLRLVKAPVIKFLNMLQPEKHPEVDIAIEVKAMDDQQYLVKGNLSFEATTFLKFKGNFHEQ